MTNKEFYPTWEEIEKCTDIKALIIKECIKELSPRLFPETYYRDTYNKIISYISTEG